MSAPWSAPRHGLGLGTVAPTDSAPSGRYLPDGRPNPAWNPSGEDHKDQPGTMFWTEGDLVTLWGDNRSEYTTAVADAGE